jgi:hypothetical protein
MIPPGHILKRQMLGDWDYMNWRAHGRLALCLISKALYHEGVWANRGICNNHSFYLCTRWRWMVSFKRLPLYPQGKSPEYPLDGWVSEYVWKLQRKVLYRRKSNTSCPAYSPSLYRLSYPDSGSKWSWPNFSFFLAFVCEYPPRPTVCTEDTGSRRRSGLMPVWSPGCRNLDPAKVMLRVFPEALKCRLPLSVVIDGANRMSARHAGVQLHWKIQPSAVSCLGVNARLWNYIRDAG